VLFVSVTLFYLLNIMIKYRYLTGVDATLRNMRISTTIVKRIFIEFPVLIQEIADVFIPQIFLKEVKGLDQPYSMEEISFARFIVTGYHFCVQSFTDTLFDFFSISKQNYNMKLKFSIFTFNFQQLLRVITEDLLPSASLQYLRTYCNRRNDDEISIETVILYGMKYPILFYELYRFVRRLKRLIFGDKFWSSRLVYS